jgi:O-antigen ligase
LSVRAAGSRNLRKLLQTSFDQTIPEERTGLTRLLDRGIFHGLIAVVVLTAIPYGTIDPWSEALFECAVFLLTLLWVVHGLCEGSWRIGNLRLVLPMIGLVILAIVQSVTWWKTDAAGEQVWWAISADPFESWAFAFRMGALVLAALLVIRFTSNLNRLGILVHAVIVVALGTAFFGIARQVMQHQTGFVLSRLQQAQGYAQFINKNHFPFLLEMGLGLVMGVGLMQRARRDLILLYLAALLLIVAAIVLSNSRGGLLAVTAQIICAALLFLNSRRLAGQQKRWLNRTRSIAVTVVIIGTLMVVIVGGVVWLGGDQLATGIETATVEMASADSSEMHEGARRRDIWRATWRMFKAHPFLGAGLGGFWAEVPIYHPASGVSTPQQAHNDYLELVASSGLLGAAIFVWFVVTLIKQARQSIQATEGFQRAVVLGAIIGIIGVGVHSIVDFGLHITINGLVLMVLLALLSIGRLSGVTIAKPVRSA